MHEPHVTTVIPTRNRPDLVIRAVQSALDQTYENLDVIVVIDGKDAATANALTALNDPRVRYIELAESLGGSEARNVGVREAPGEWIAFLDDDDEWMPSKIVKQIALAQTAPKSDFTVIACRVIGRTPSRDYIWPTRFPSTGEPLSEYLLARNTWFRGEGQLQTSMLLVPRELMLMVPFTRGLPKHQDTDWYVRIGARGDISVKYVDEPLAIWYLEENRPTIVKNYDWKRSFEWLNGVRPLITPRAYSGFLATQLAGEAAAQQAWSAFRPLTSALFKFGEPKPIDLAIYIGNWILTRKVRSSLRRIVSRAN
jgi:glycosyltransferase involved in cell wall biosynthesis